MLAMRKDILPFLSLVLLLVTAAVPMYLFMGPIARYLVAIIPALALLSATVYGICQPGLNLRNARVPVALAVVMLLVYAGAVYGRYEILLLRGDTRVQAYNWVEANIPAGSTVIDDFGSVASFRDRGLTRHTKSTCPRVSARQRPGASTRRAVHHASLCTCHSPYRNSNIDEETPHTGSARAKHRPCLCY